MKIDSFGRNETIKWRHWLRFARRHKAHTTGRASPIAVSPAVCLPDKCGNNCIRINDSPKINENGQFWWRGLVFGTPAGIVDLISYLSVFRGDFGDTGDNRYLCGFFCSQNVFQKGDNGDNRINSGFLSSPINTANRKIRIFTACPHCPRLFQYCLINRLLL